MLVLIHLPNLEVQPTRNRYPKLRHATYVFSLDEWNWSSYSFLTCFSSFCVIFSWINIVGFIIVLDWFTPEWYWLPCLFVRINITWKNLPVLVIFISWWKCLCRTALAQLLVQVQSLSRSSALILMDSDQFGKNNLSSRKLQKLCSGGYQLSFLLVKQYVDLEMIVRI